MLTKRTSYRLGGHVVHLVQLALSTLTLACLEHPLLSVLFAFLGLTLFVVDRLYFTPKLKQWTDEFVSRLQHAVQSDDSQAVYVLIRRYAWIRFFGRQEIVFHALGEASLAQEQYENAILYFRKATLNGDRASRIDACFGVLRAARAVGDEKTIATYLGKLRQNETWDALVNARLERLENEGGLG
ncbi:MAG: hypothetical protein ACPGQS_05665 [Bradymonadia bacterium]